MAEKGFILSAEEELKLREPIDEYIGKIQEQIDALRLDGTDKVRSLKNHIAVVKESKNLSKEEKTKIIKKLYSLNIPIEKISEITEMCIEDVQKIVK